MDRFQQIAKDEGITTHPVDEQNHVTRQEAARQACEREGIIWPGTILPEGTALYESGVDKLKCDRARWAKLPDAHTGIAVVKAALAAEDRKDLVVKLDALHFDKETARVANFVTTTTAERTGLMGYDGHSFRQLVNSVPTTKPGTAPRGFASSLLFLDADERAAVLNRRLSSLGDKAPTITLRTKMAHSGDRIVRAVLSERYADLGDIHVGEALEAALGDGLARMAKLDYKPGDSKSRFEVIFPSEIPVKTFVVGDVHYAGIVIENSETGEGSATVRSFLMRAACANLSLSMGEGVVLRHIGKSERLQGSMRAAVKAAMSQLDSLIGVIQKSASEALGTDHSPADILRALAEKYEVQDRAQSWVTTYESKYAQSPTTWGITSAITEAAQGAEWWGATAEEEKIAADVMQVGVRKALGF